MLAYAQHYGLARPVEDDLHRLLDCIQTSQVDEQDLEPPIQGCSSTYSEQSIRWPLRINRDAAQLLEDVSNCTIDRTTQWSCLSRKFHSELELPLERRVRIVQIEYSIPESLPQALDVLEQFCIEDDDETLFLQHDVRTDASWTHGKFHLPKESLSLLQAIASLREISVVCQLHDTVSSQHEVVDIALIVVLVAV